MKYQKLCILAFLALMTSCFEDNEVHSSSSLVIPNSEIVFGTDDSGSLLAGYADRRVAVEVNGEVRMYMIDGKGNLTSSNPFIMVEGESTSVRVWYPFSEQVYPATPVVQANQAVSSFYEKSDVMVGEYTNGLLTFRHLTSKLTFTLYVDGAASSAGKITVLNVQGVNTGTSIRTATGYNAFVCPQTLVSGTDFILVDLGDRTLTYTLPENLVLEAGKHYQLDVRVTSAGITCAVQQDNSWNGNEETLNGSSNGASTNGTGDAWNGSGSAVDGSSNGASADGNGSGWNGNGSTVGGSTTGADADGNGSGWNGNGSTVGGSTTGTDADGNSGGWNGNGSTVGGSTTGTDTNGTTGGWNGNGSTVGGSTTGTDAGGSTGGWNGEGSTGVTGATPTTNISPSGGWTGTPTTVTGTKEE